jgi:hypothetical protein
VIFDASIMGLATLLATVLPFAQAPLSSQVATAIINLAMCSHRKRHSAKGSSPTIR